MSENKFLIPAAIIVAALLIAGALFFTGSDDNTPNNTGEVVGDSTVSINPVDRDDHILGNPDASIKIVEYSDIDCPFCATYHQTMNRIIDEYGPTGEVAWVYRHFPIQQLHPEAPRKALAAECVADVADNQAFWEYLDILFEGDENASDLESLAVGLGVDSTEFNECMEEERFVDEINEDVRDAQSAGAKGTPHSVLVTPDGELVPIEGAQPYEAVKQIIDTILNEA